MLDFVVLFMSKSFSILETRSSAVLALAEAVDGGIGAAVGVTFKPEDPVKNERFSTFSFKALFGERWKVNLFRTKKDTRDITSNR